MKQERYDEALPFLRDQPSEQGRELLATALIYSGTPQAAIDTLKTLPRTAGVLYLLGVANTRLKKEDSAQDVFAELMKIASPDQANFLIGKANYEAGRFEEAARAFAGAGALQGVHRELGKVFVSLRRNTEAESELKLALREDPVDAEASYFLGGLLALQPDRVSEAKGPLEAALRMNPDSWGASYYLGRVRLEQGDAVGAVSLLERAGRLKPDEASIFYLLARALKQAGHDDESRKALEKVRQLRAGRLEEETEILTRRRP
jgi:predicted Zn-dependent protease